MKLGTPENHPIVSPIPRQLVTKNSDTNWLMVSVSEAKRRKVDGSTSASKVSIQVT